MPPLPIVHDGLWRCLCPSFQPSRTLAKLPRARPSVRPRPQPPKTLPFPTSRASARPYNTSTNIWTGQNVPESTAGASPRPFRNGRPPLVELTTRDLYERLRFDAAAGRHEEVMNIVQILIKDRRERLSQSIYSAILHSFVSPSEGTAGKVRKVLEEMQEEGIEPDAQTCHNVLEVRRSCSLWKNGNAD